MEESAFVSGFTLTMALIVIAGSASTTLSRTGRRDRYGRIDPTALGSIVTVIAGPAVAALIALIPSVVAVLTHNPGLAGWTILTDQVGRTTQATVWAWTAGAIIMFWLYALTSTVYTTGAYYLQQHRQQPDHPDA